MVKPFVLRNTWKRKVFRGHVREERERDMRKAGRDDRESAQEGEKYVLWGQMTRRRLLNWQKRVRRKKGLAVGCGKLPTLTFHFFTILHGGTAVGRLFDSAIVFLAGHAASSYKERRASHLLIGPAWVHHIQAKSFPLHKDAYSKMLSQIGFLTIT